MSQNNTYNDDNNTELLHKFNQLDVNDEPQHTTYNTNSTSAKGDQARRKVIQEKEKELEERAKFLLGKRGHKYYRPKRKAKYLDFNEAAEQMRQAEEREQSYIRQAKQNMNRNEHSNHT